MKRAALGFRYISLDKELQVVESEDLQIMKESRQRTSHARTKEAKLRCYHKNREMYNAQRREKSSSMESKFSEAQRQAAIAGVQWEFTPESWAKVWKDAGWITFPGSHSAKELDGVTVPAFALRGPHRYNNTCMVRKDLSKGWNPENCEIVFRGEPLIPGSRWYKQAPK